MLLIITSIMHEYMLKDFFKHQTEEIFMGLGVKKFLTSSIKNILKIFIEKNEKMKKFKYIIIDLSIMIDKHEDIINSLVEIKKISEIRIIILCFNTSKKLINTLIQNRFYNLVLGENQYVTYEQIKTTLSEDGQKYSQVSKYLQDLKPKKFDKIKSKVLVILTAFKIFKKDTEINEAINLDTNEKELVQEQKIDNNTEKNILDKLNLDIEASFNKINN